MRLDVPAHLVVLMLALTTCHASSSQNDFAKVDGNNPGLGGSGLTSGLLQMSLPTSGSNLDDVVPVKSLKVISLISSVALKPGSVAFLPAVGNALR